ncbi:unknown protein [Azorhizobium caulinodans ORS 571]|uniref:Uncharacterized protein n=1 Tax=Azorhizobium caulinodans (strain ATCC 43989 / DSM 5975 / JCM 20966 / LMG 6465 / NBRC 14845 / NCIMB 13405 / ORS 571) TaxID=438753 RepID=A8HV57_AZOC5|nr:unknown protein [Azorhizobium caulinodans ORS 571]
MRTSPVATYAAFVPARTPALSVGIDGGGTTAHEAAQR